MRNTIKYISNTEAKVTKAFAKRAVIFGTPEFDEWRKYKDVYPEAEMVSKTRVNKTKTISTRNLSYENMEIFISEQDNASELLVEFRRIRKISCIQTSPYHSVLAWFLEKFENYDSYKEFLGKFAEEVRRKAEAEEKENAAA